MPPLVFLIVVCILLLTAYIIVHPNPIFEDSWELYTWKGPKVSQFANNLKVVTFALGETKENISLVPSDPKIQPMELELDEISGSELRAHADKNNLQFKFTYDMEPYEHAKLVICEVIGRGEKAGTREIAELIFVPRRDI